jgi:D-alanine-D-alanine ligase
MSGQTMSDQEAKAPQETGARVAVVFGGQSGEHDVSLASARSVMNVLRQKGYRVVPVGITRAGRWLLNGDPHALLSAGGPESTEPAGEESGNGRELVPGATGQKFPAVDVVFPVLHGPHGEDGTLQGLLELAGVPYVGCGVLASSLAMDKIACKQLLASHGVPVVPFTTVLRSAWERTPQSVLASVEEDLGYPVFVKPANLGSSIGVSKVEVRGGLIEALNEAARYDRRILVERAVANPREIECAVLGNDNPVASMPGEVVPSNDFYDYAAKYIDGKSALLIPAPLPQSTAARVRELAVKAFQAIDGAGLARVDFLLSDTTGELYLNELNTMPGFTAISMYPKLWEATGIPYDELVERLIGLALERHGERIRSLMKYDGGHLTA